MLLVAVISDLLGEIREVLGVLVTALRVRRFGEVEGSAAAEGLVARGGEGFVADSNRSLGCGPSNNFATSSRIDVIRSSAIQRKANRRTSGDSFFSASRQMLSASSAPRNLAD